MAVAVATVDTARPGSPLAALPRLWLPRSVLWQFFVLAVEKLDKEPLDEEPPPVEQLDEALPLLVKELQLLDEEMQMLDEEPQPLDKELQLLKGPR